MRARALSWLFARGAGRLRGLELTAWILDWQARNCGPAPHGLRLGCECVVGAEDCLEWRCLAACGAAAITQIRGMLLCGYCAGDHPPADDDTT